MGFDRKMGRLFLTVLMLFVFAGCSRNEKVRQERSSRIACVSTAAAAVLCKMGTAPAAVDEYCLDLVAPGTPVAGKGTALSPERLLELKIDTLVHWSYQRNALEHLSRYGIRLVEVAPVRVANFPELVRKMETLTGKKEASEKIIAEFLTIFSTLKQERKAFKRVYLELYSRNRGAGDDSYAGDLLRLAGGRSILKKSALTSSEHIITQNPEVIFYVEGMGSAEEIMKRSGFSSLEAVKSKRVFAVPRKLLVEGAFPLEAVEFFRKRMDQ